MMAVQRNQSEQSPKNGTRRLAALFLSMFLIATVFFSCSSGKEAKNYRESGSGTAVIDDKSFATVDLTALLDPDGYTRILYGTKRWNALDPDAQFSAALDAFYTEYAAETLVLRRNRIQERLITASDHSCSAFLDFLMTDQESRRGLTGAMVSSGRTAAKIVTGINPVTAAGNVVSFVTRDDESRLESAEFASLTIQVISEGIEIRRQRQLHAMTNQRVNAGIEAYPVETAIRDALEYHRQCSIVAGMSEARDLLVSAPQAQ